VFYLIGAYWPFILLAVAIGAAAGWWYQHPRQVDEVTAWLEHGSDGL
jgi:hypothetical protein